MKNICIVEDEITILDLIVELLIYTYNVTEFNDSSKALEWLKKNGKDIDLLILDVYMGNLSGIELGNIIKELYPNLKILYTSGYMTCSKPHLKNEYFLSKPFTFKELCGKINKIVNN